VPSTSNPPPIGPQPAGEKRKEACLARPVGAENRDNPSCPQKKGDFRRAALPCRARRRKQPGPQGGSSQQLHLSPGKEENEGEGAKNRGDDSRGSSPGKSSLAIPSETRTKSAPSRHGGGMADLPSAPAFRRTSWGTTRPTQETIPQTAVTVATPTAARAARGPARFPT
jgi:hypothetical protein